MTKIIKMTKICVTIISITLMLCGASKVEASQIFLEGPDQIQPNQEFLVDVFLDTQGKNINAISGQLVFDPEQLSVKSIINTDGVVNLWLVQPKETLTGKIDFEGVVPGGFAGLLSPEYQGVRPGRLFTVEFLAKKTGTTEILFANLRVLLHDGQGTSDKSAFLPTTLFIDPQANYQKPEITDKNPPEVFAPEIISDKNTDNGKFFLIFSAQDKGSGVAYYEVLESGKKITFFSKELKWERAQSPYLLKDQKSRSFIYIKAVDNFGNERIVVFGPDNPQGSSQNMPFYAIISLVAVLLLGLLLKYKLVKINQK